MLQKGRFNNALPIISLYVFASYRMMPAFKQIYASFVSLTFVRPSLDKLYDDMSKLKKLNLNQDQGILSFNKSIRLKNIHFNMPILHDQP